ncbi:MAG: cyanophycin synthetase [Symbiobacteriia bacterium]
MKILRQAVYEGPNVHSHYPVVETLVDLEELDGITTQDVSGFTERLLAAVPSLREHYCGLGYPGGFVERLLEGTYFGHVLEHLTLEMQALAGMPVIYGKTRFTGSPRVYRIVYEYTTRQAGVEGARLALSVLEQLLAGRAPAVAEAVQNLRDLAARSEPGPSTAALIAAAKARGIPVLRLDNDSLVQLGYGKNARRVCATLTSSTSCIAADIASDKHLTKSLLEQAGLPVPEGLTCASADEAWSAAQDIGLPVVVKPLDGNQGKGVFVNLGQEAAIRRAFEFAQEHSRRVVVERYVTGRQFRVLVVGDRVVAVAERIPAHVKGDGERTIRELVSLANQDPQRGVDHEKPLTRLRLDEVSLSYLARQGLTPDSVPAFGTAVYLRDSANLSTGGTAVDATDEIHPATAMAAIRAAKTVGLDVAGIDLVTPDVSQPLEEVGGVIIEVTGAPGIRMHHFPSHGRPRDAAGAIINWLFPSAAASRVPIVAITGTNGKTTVTRLVSHLLSGTGLTVGTAATDGIYIGDRCLRRGDTTGPRSARTVLQDGMVEAAVLETARGGIIRGGLGFDQCDVGVVTNLSEDHLGQDGVETLADLAHVKSLVVETVRPGGTAVLNADDPLVATMAELSGGGVVFFSCSGENLVVRRHTATGGRAVVVRRGALHVLEGDRSQRLLPVANIPITLNGLAEHNVANAAAAAATAVAMGLPLEAIRLGLKTFAATAKQNPGRLNIVEAGDFRVVIDYGHNAAGYEATLRTLRALQPSRLTGVIGMPGDRRDEDALHLGRIAARYLDYCIIKEDVDLRGRRSGDTAGLMLQGVRLGGGATRSEIVLDESLAVRGAMERAQPGEIVVVFYEKLDRVAAVVAQVAQELAGRTRPAVADVAVGPA